LVGVKDESDAGQDPALAVLPRWLLSPSKHNVPVGVSVRESISLSFSLFLILSLDNNIAFFNNNSIHFSSFKMVKAG
jgi:hypothetical protein